MSEEFFKKTVDELIISAEHDPELKDGLEYLDKKATEKGITIYEMIFEVLYKHDMNESVKDWLRKRN